MSPEEIRRRITVLHGMKKKQRPFVFKELQELSGIRDDNIHGIVRAGFMPTATAPKLGRALETLEQKHASVEMRTRVRITASGPKLEFVAVNPAALPVLPEINK